MPPTRLSGCALIIGAVFSTVAAAGPPAFEPLVPRDAPPLARPRAEQVFQAALSTQGQLKQVTACFRVEQPLDTRLIPQEVLNRADVDPTTKVHSTLRWARDGQRQRLERYVGLPEELKRYSYEDALWVDDGRVQAFQLLRTRQTVLEKRGALSGITPANWLLPPGGLGLGALSNDPNARVELFDLGPGLVGLRARGPSDPASGLGGFEAVLDEAFDYAVVRWRCAGLGEAGRIEYERDRQGRVFPVRALLGPIGTESEDSLFVLHTESLTYGAPAPGTFELPFTRGMVVSDNRQPGASRILRWLRLRLFRSGP